MTSETPTNLLLRRRGRIGVAASALALSCVVTACSTPTESAKDSDAAGGAPQHTVTVTNCGEQKDYQAPARRMLAYDGSIVSIALAAGAGPNINAIDIGHDRELLSRVYGEEFDRLRIAGETPTKEQAVAENTDLMFAGWSYGFSEEKGLTPDTLAERGIASYILSESCRGKNGARGTMPPWEALDTDLRNIATLAGDPARAEQVVDDIGRRRDALEKAPQAPKPPTAFVFDSGADAPFTSGNFGAPQAILEAAGARNAMSDLADTWVTTTWESVAGSAPDVFVFVDYPPETLAQKIDVLRHNPATRDLPAVRENRFVNLPYAMWTSGPLNIDAAELVRKGLENFRLVPPSPITPKLAWQDLGVDGNEWAH